MDIIDGMDGAPIDANAPEEIIRDRMKTEWLQPEYKTRAEAIRNIYEYI